jgi:hypothetical protein
MKLSEYLTANDIGVPDFARKIRVTPQCVRLYIEGKRTPRPAQMQAIFTETAGAVTANDFFLMEGAA